MVGHWLVVDALSMKILFDRIHGAVDQQMRGESIRLRARPASSFVEWARHRAPPVETSPEERDNPMLPLQQARGPHAES